MTINYLDKLQRARNIDMIAMYIRAHAGYVALSIVATCRSLQEASDIMRKYEYDAQSIERCETLDQARRILKTRGYIYPNKTIESDSPFAVLRKD